MEIILEKIELVKDRTGVGYKEAKDALEKAEGSVVDAIISIEENIDETSKSKMGSQSAAILDAIKDAIKKGNVSKITIKKDDDVLLNLPLSIGIIGTVLFPWAVIGGTIAAFGTKCTIELVKDDGEIINISTKASETFDTVVTKGSVIVDEMKDKGGDFANIAKEKGQEAWDVAKEKGSEMVDAVKVKAGETMKKNPKEEDLRGFCDFDLSDIDMADVVEPSKEETEPKAKEKKPAAKSKKPVAKAKEKKPTTKAKSDKSKE